MVAYSAVHKAGAVAVPTNTRLTDGELERLLGHAEVRVVLTDTELSPLAHRVAGTLDRPRARDRRPAAADDAPAPRRGRGPCPAPTTTGTFQVEVDGDDLADILYTSGTTGLPKGVAIRHRNVALIPGAPNPNYSGQCWLHASPLFTFAGIGFIYNPMQLGLFGVYQPKFDAGRWLEVVEELRPQFVFLVPSMAQLIVAHPALRRRRALLHRHLRHRQRPARARHLARPAGAHARGVGLQQLRHDRGGARLLLHAQGGVAQADRLGRPARAAARGAHRRRGRPRPARRARSARRSCA